MIQLSDVFLVGPVDYDLFTASDIADTADFVWVETDAALWFNWVFNVSEIGCEDTLTEDGDIIDSSNATGVRAATSDHGYAEFTAAFPYVSLDVDNGVIECRWPQPFRAESAAGNADLYINTLFDSFIQFAYFEKKFYYKHPTGIAFDSYVFTIDADEIVFEGTTDAGTFDIVSRTVFTANEKYFP